MNRSKMFTAILIMSGIIGVFVGGNILLDPIHFYAASGISLGENISLLNEIRASGGALVAVGGLIFIGAFWKKLTFTSIIISMLMFLSYGFSRVLSMLLDGMPKEIFVTVAVCEIVIGLLAFFALLKYNKKEE